MKNVKSQDFYLQIAYALSGCQLVEQALKVYLTDALELAQKCIGHRMTFKFCGDDYEDSSLEGLIKAFRKLSSNEQLVRDLEAFKKERNFLSHKGITFCLDYEGELASDLVGELAPRLVQIQESARMLHHSLHEAANDFRGYLYFEEFSTNKKAR